MKLNRLIYLVLFIILLPLALGLSFSWWDTNWNYRRSIQVTENSGQNLTDYILNMTIDTASLISEGKLNSDCSDLRFTYYNESNDTEVDIQYYVASGCNTTNTEVYVKIPYLEAYSTTTLYMYYGNPSAVDAGNSSIVNEYYNVTPEPTYEFGDKEEVWNLTEYVDVSWDYYDYAFANDTFTVKSWVNRVDTNESLSRFATCSVEYLNVTYDMTYNSENLDLEYNLTPSYDYYHQNYTISCSFPDLIDYGKYENDTHIIYNYYINASTKTYSVTDYFDVYIGEIPEDWPLTDRPYRIVVRVKNPSDTYPILDYIYSITLDTTSYVSNGMMRSDCRDIEAYYKQRIGYIKFKVCNDKYSKPHDKWWFTYQFDPDTLAQYAIHQPSFVDIRAFTYFPENPYLETPDVDAWYIGNNKFVFIVSKTLNPGQCTDVYVYFGGYSQVDPDNYAKYSYYKYLYETWTYHRVSYVDRYYDYYFTLGTTGGSWPGIWGYWYYLGENSSEALSNLPDLLSLQESQEEFSLLFISPFPIGSVNTIVAKEGYDDAADHYIGKGCLAGPVDIYRDGLLKLITAKVSESSAESCLNNIDDYFSYYAGDIYFAPRPWLQVNDNVGGYFFAWYVSYKNVYEASSTVEEINSTYTLMKLPTAVANCNTANTEVTFLLPILYPNDDIEVYLYFGDGEVHAYNNTSEIIQNWFDMGWLKVDNLIGKYYNYGTSSYYTYSSDSSTYAALGADSEVQYYYKADSFSYFKPFTSEYWPMYSAFVYKDGVNILTYHNIDLTYIFLTLPSNLRNIYSYTFDLHYFLRSDDNNIKVCLQVNTFSDSVESSSKENTVELTTSDSTIDISYYIKKSAYTSLKIWGGLKYKFENFTVKNPYDPEYIEHWEDALFKVTSPRMYDAKHNVTLIKATVPGGTDWVEFWMTKPDGSDELIANDTNRSDGFEVEFDFSNYPEGYYELWINTSSGLSPVRVKIYVDHTNPTAITEKPEPVVYYDRNIVVKVYGNDNYALDKCYYKLDTGSWQEVLCGLPIKIYNLAEGEHTFWSRVVDKAGLMSEDTVKFMIYKYYGGLAMRPTPTPARGLVLPPAELIELRRRYETLRRAVLITGTASIASIIYLILLILGIL